MDVPVKSSAYSPNIQLDTIEEEQDDIGVSSGEYPGSSMGGTDTGPPMTRCRDRNSSGNTE